MCKKFTYLLSFVLVLCLVGIASAALPAGWTSQDINTTGGSADDINGTWTVSGDGADIWDSSDAFHYAFVPLSGDGQIVVRVVDNGEGTNDWAKGGVMIRETLEPGSKFAAVYSTTPANGVRFQKRAQSDSGATSDTSVATNEQKATVEPVWLKLERKGNEFNAYYTKDPQTEPWVIMSWNPQTVEMTDTVYIGLAVTSHQAGEVRTFTFDNVGTELPTSAMKPIPGNFAVLEETWANLSWTASAFAVSHDVYLGDNFDDVDAGAKGTFQCNQSATNLIVGFPTFPYPDGLLPGTTYYWRIDEVNDLDPNSPWNGDVWCFTIPPRTAYNPSPANGVKFVVPDVELSWTAGLGAKVHYVYFEDNFDDANNVTGGLYQTETTYTPGPLELEKTYYWRVDESDGITIQKGDVWSFKTLPDIPITDPNLVGWWKFDEGTGSTAIDWSGHGNHGAINGDPQSVAGYDGDAFEFYGIGDYVNCGNGPSLQIQDAITIAFWFKVDAFQTTWEAFLSKGDNSYRVSRGGGDGDATHMGISGTSVGGGNGWFNGNVIVTDNQWHHWSGVYDGAQGKIYIDGVLDVTSPGTGQINISTYELWIGTNSQNTNRLLHGLMDEVRIYNKALTADEIQQAMRGDTTRAWSPSPANGSTPYIREATPLSWWPGDNASLHDVYFGIDRDAVADSNASDTTGIYRGRQGVTIYTPSEGVEWGVGPYYWRVDEYNTDSTISEGRIWSFTVADFIEIDGFEDYNDYPPDEIFSTWIDGWEVPTNGSMAGYSEPPFAETSIVHGGSQSMPLSYDNNFMYSDITMTLVSARDWTEERVGVLSLWFRGNSDNVAERMYVALNGSATVYHDNPNAALIDTWTEWTIDLQVFAAQGVNLTNVNTITIGFGDKNNLQPGGSGVVFFDDIRLYRSTEPEPEPKP
ncbi:hypothetical protein ES707_18215 [subsurface metagenome]